MCYQRASNLHTMLGYMGNGWRQHMVRVHVNVELSYKPVAHYRRSAHRQSHPDTTFTGSEYEKLPCLIIPDPCRTALSDPHSALWSHRRLQTDAQTHLHRRRPEKQTQTP
jgi:hypothetical protein